MLSTKAEEILSFAEAHSLYLHPDFQPLSLFPKDMTFPSSPVARGRLHESPPYYSEWSPSPEQHRDPMHQVAIPLHDDVVKPQHLPMPGMDFPSHDPGHNPPPTNHVPPSQPPVDGKKGTAAKSTGSERAAGNTPASKAEVVIPPRTDRSRRVASIKNDRDAALTVARNREITWHPCGKWVSCMEVHFFCLISAHPSRRACNYTVQGSCGVSGHLQVGKERL